MSDRFPSRVPVPNPNDLALKNYLDDVERRILELYRIGRKISETDETLSYQRRRIDGLEKQISYLKNEIEWMKEPWWFRLKVWFKSKFYSTKYSLTNLLP